MQSIQSRDNARVKHACRLSASAAQRAEEGLFFAEGIRLCLDLAQRLRAQEAFFTQKVLDAHPEVDGMADEAYLVSGPVAEKLADTKTPQGLFCVFRRPVYGPQDLAVEKGVLLCEAVGDPANVGTMVRTAAGLGFGGVVLGGKSADPFGARALRAAMGGVARIPVLDGADLEDVAGTLRAAGATLYAAALEGARPVAEIIPRRPFALLVGNEGAGLSEKALALAEERVYIPMHGGVESLNVAAAAAVLMYRLAAWDV